MQRKSIVLLTIIILLSLALTPAGGAQAQSEEPTGAAGCPRYEPGILQEKDFLRTLPPECVREYKEAARQVAAQAAPEADAGAKAGGGPDNFGYTYTDMLTYSWVSAATNSGLTGDDEFSGPVNIGFSFPFYGVRQTQLYFNTNGMITFGSGTPEYGASWVTVPDDRVPNHFIAPFWEDLLVGAPYNNGAVYYSTGGTAPNRYFVMEWRNVENYDGTGTFSFEAILLEGGDIIVQYQSVPSDFDALVGIENINGSQGLKYMWSPAPGKIIRFSYPATPAARVLAYAQQPGGFVPLGRYSDFPIVVINQGNMGTDRYDITLAASAWPVTYHAANGVPLTDTDGDGKIDTGPMAAGSSLTILARYRSPAGAVVGDGHSHQVQLTSSINPSVSMSTELKMAIPAGFVSGFTDFANGAMSFTRASADGATTYKATGNQVYGYDAAVAKLPNGNYLYAWSRFYSGAGRYWSNIEYVILSPNGGIVLPVTKLTNNSGASISTDDDLPSIAVAPNGTVGIVWSRRLDNITTGQHNNNIFFATLNAAGARLTGPTNITNNTVWGTWSDVNIPELTDPSIAATSDNRFVMAWTDSREFDFPNPDQDNIWYAVRSTAGASLKAPTGLTYYNTSLRPVVNTLNGGKVIVTWSDYGYNYYDVYYAVLNSSGAIIKPTTSPGYPEAITWGSHDAVQLPNGKVAVAWANGMGVEFGILDASYNLEGGHHIGNDDDIGDNVSITTDAASRVIMTWISGNYNKMFYALGDSTGAFLTDPMPYYASWDYIAMSWGGVGTAPYQGSPVISGTTGVASTILTYTGGSITANAGGKYSFLVPLGWSGTVTPSKANYSFAPTNRAYTNVTSDKIAQNYAATSLLHSISGNTGVGGVALKYMDGTPKTVVSQADGSYSFQILRGWSGTVTPSKSGYIFSPADRTYSNVTANQSAQNYTAIPLYDISGNVGVAGVTLSYTDGTAKTVTSQADGSYSLSVPSGWSGTITSSHPCFTFDPVDQDYTSVSGNLTVQDYTPSFNAGTGCSDVNVEIGAALQGRFGLQPGASTRASFGGLDGGPVKLESTNAVPIIGAERLIYKVGNAPTSFTEMMGLPDSQLDTTYWLPWYNNTGLDTQLRFANVSNATASVHVYIGGDEMQGSPFTLLAGESLKKSFPGIDDGPVEIVSDQNIVAAARLIYKVSGANTSFSEIMALPASQLDTTYWLPWYNNTGLDTQLRFANVSNATASVHVYIGGEEMTGSPFTLLSGESTRKSFPGIDDGPVQIVSDQDIVAAERLIYKANGLPTSFTEMMALPDKSLDTTYWLPWYNNTGLDTQLRFANVSNLTATVHIYIGGEEVDGSPFTLPVDGSMRISFPGIDDGPVQIVSDQNIVVAERLIYKVNNIPASFGEMMALPNSQLDTTYWLPWYNNVGLDTQLRFGVP